MCSAGLMLPVRGARHPYSNLRNLDHQKDADKTLGRMLDRSSVLKRTIRGHLNRLVFKKWDLFPLSHKFSPARLHTCNIHHLARKVTYHNRLERRISLPACIHNTQSRRCIPRISQLTMTCPSHCYLRWVCCAFLWLTLRPISRRTRDQKAHHIFSMFM